MCGAIYSTALLSEGVRERRDPARGGRPPAHRRAGPALRPPRPRPDRRGRYADVVVFDPDRVGYEPSESATTSPAVRGASTPRPPASARARQRRRRRRRRGRSPARSPARCSARAATPRPSHLDAYELDRLISRENDRGGQVPQPGHLRDRHRRDLLDHGVGPGAHVHDVGHLQLRARRRRVRHRVPLLPAEHRLGMPIVPRSSSRCSSSRRCSGSLLDRILLRRLAKAPVYARIVGTIGLLGRAARARSQWLVDTSATTCSSSSFRATNAATPGVHVPGHRPDPARGRTTRSPASSSTPTRSRCSIVAALAAVAARGS